MIVLPAMPAEQTASWLGILDLYDRLNEGWTLIGGQLVHLHCAERGEFPVRPTNDADTVIDVRADPTILHTFTKTLEDLGFKSAGISAEGRQHRWKRADASIDVLLPEGIGGAPANAKASLEVRPFRRKVAPRPFGAPRSSRSASTGAKASCAARISSARWSSRPRRTPSPVTATRAATAVTSSSWPA
jgi:hypothetical protein